MNQLVLTSLTVEQLVDLFAASALGQDDAMMARQYDLYNQLFDDLEGIRIELRSRPGDARHALLPLLGHDNPQVRLKAAIFVLAIAPEAGRRALQTIVDHEGYPHRGRAWGILDSLDKGQFVPK